MALNLTQSETLELVEDTPGVSDEDAIKIANKAIEIRTRHSTGRMQKHNEGPLTSRGPEPHLPKALRAYERAVAALIGEQFDSDARIQAFILKYLPGGKLFDSTDDAVSWLHNEVQRLGGPVEAPGERSLIYLYTYEHDNWPESLPVEIPFPKRDCGLFAELKQLSTWASGKFRWSEQIATAAILVTLKPITPCFAAFTSLHEIPALNRIVMEIDPYLRPEQVANIYRRERTRLKKKWSKRPFSEKLLALAAFTASFPDDRMVDKWNEWNERHSPFGRRPHRWAYGPKYVTRKKTPEELRADADFLSEEKGRGYSPLQRANFVIVPPENEPKDAARREAGFANFRRDAAKIRRQLWDPYRHASPPKTARDSTKARLFDHTFASFIASHEAQTEEQSENVRKIMDSVRRKYNLKDKNENGKRKKVKNE